MPPSSGLPLFLLPLVVLEQILKMMTPFEQVFLSLTSKSSEAICKMLLKPKGRYKYLLKNKLKMDYCSVEGVKLSSWSSKATPQWIFRFLRFPEKKKGLAGKWSKVSSFVRGRKKQKFAKLMEGIHISSFEQRIEIPKVQVWKAEEHSLDLYYSYDYVSAVSIWIHYLRDLFHIKLKKFTLYIDQFEEEKTLEIIERICGDMKQIQMALKSQNVIENSTLVNKIISRKNWSCIKFDFKTRPEFKCDFENLNQPIQMITIKDATWMDIEQLLTIHTAYLNLYYTNFGSEDFKNMIRSFIGGWSPNSEPFIVNIVLRTIIDIDLCIEQVRGELGLNGDDEDIKFRRFENLFEDQNGTYHEIKYGIFRSDFGSLNITMGDGNVGFFIFSKCSRSSIFSNDYDKSTLEL